MLDVRGGRFLLATIDGGGTAPPELGLAARLVQRGHKVRVLADPTLESGATAAGCEFSPWRTAPHVSSVPEQTAVLTEMERGGPLRQFRMARDRYISGPARQFADDVVSVTREHPVDAVMVEAVLSGALVGAAATGMPRVALMPNVYMVPAPGRPPFGTGWSPGKGRLGRARDKVANAAMRRVFASFTPGVNVARAAYGLPAIPEMFALLDDCDRVLVLSSPAFDFPALALPSNVRYVGAQLDDPHWAASDDWRPPGSDPLVLVATSSTFQSQVDALRRIAAALGRLPVRGVITTGPAVAPDDVPAPTNVRVVRAAPHTQVLREASVVLTHAGHGSTLKALAAGVPLVCMPMGRDQKDNTARVLRLGAGVRIGKREPVSGITSAVQRVLTEPSYTEAARRFSATLQDEVTRLPDAVSEVEQVLPQQ